MIYSFYTLAVVVVLEGSWYFLCVIVVFVVLYDFQLEREKTNGRGWFNMPAPDLTEEKKNDLLVIQMRRALDPKRFYKGPDRKGLPKYFQVCGITELCIIIINY